MRVVVGGGGLYGPFDEITTLSMAGGDCGRGRALWNVRRTTALKWTLGWYPVSFLDPRTWSLEISADVVQPQWLSVHRTVKISISQCEPRRSCSDITYPSAVCDLWDPMGMGHGTPPPDCEIPEIRHPASSRTLLWNADPLDPTRQIFESWNPKSVCWLICCSAAGISRHLKQHIQL
jgi:hypothetical protein